MKLKSLAFCCFTLAASWCLPSLAADVLVEGHQVSVADADVASEALRIPADVRSSVLSKPENVSKLATGLYVQRVLAQEAEKAGLTDDPTVATALRLAGEHVLSEARLQKIDEAAKPDDAALDAYASATYKANQQRFQAPERWAASHILINGNSLESRIKASKLQEELKSGADFAALARKNSDDAASAVKGGKLGYFTSGKVVPEFEAAVKALKNPGDISDVVETKYGMHIIRLDGHREAGTKPFDEVRDELRAEALAKLTAAARAREQDRILGAATFNQAAIDAYAATQAK